MDCNVDYAASGTALSVTGVSRTTAVRAIKWLKDRSVPAFYRASDRSLCTFQLKGGNERTYETLYRAIDAVRS